MHLEHNDRFTDAIHLEMKQQVSVSAKVPGQGWRRSICSKSVSDEETPLPSQKISSNAWTETRLAFDPYTQAAMSVVPMTESATLCRFALHLFDIHVVGFEPQTCSDATVSTESAISNHLIRLVGLPATFCLYNPQRQDITEDICNLYQFITRYIDMECS